MHLVEIHELNKSYGKVHALKGLNLKIPQASLYGLLGPNGAGKTTSLRILCTLLAPDSGQVKLCGIDVAQDPRKARMHLGYVAQEVAIDKILTGRELLQLQGDLYHLEPKKKNDRINQMIERLDMSEWIDRRCGSYSGGMRRRLDLSSGLLHEPDLLVLDEPTVGLDLESRNVIWQLLRELVRQGKTILLSSHYLEEVESLSDEIAIIDNGKVIAEGPPENLKKELGGDHVTLRVREFSDQKESLKVKTCLEGVSGVRSVVVNRSQGFSLNLVVDNEEVIDRLRIALKSSQIDVFALAHSRPSLDDVYLQATGRTLLDAEIEVLGTRDTKLENKQTMR